MSLEQAIIKAFPGFIDDTDVNGGDLVEFIDLWLKEKGVTDV